MSWPETPYERLCVIHSTLLVLADTPSTGAGHVENIARGLAREIDSILPELENDHAERRASLRGDVADEGVGSARTTWRYAGASSGCATSCTCSTMPPMP